MINLELTDLSSQRTIDINKINYLLIGDYSGYLKFYTFFYESLVSKNKDYKIKIDNSVIDSKNSLFFDFTSVYNIFLALEFKKGTLLYEHMISRLNSLDESWENSIDKVFSNLVDYLNDEDSDYCYSMTDDMKKIITQSIQISHSRDNLKSTFSKLLEEFLNNNFNKHIVIFVDTMIVDFDFSKYENILVFDVNNSISLKKYNLLSVDEIKELDFEVIKMEIQNIYPISLDVKKVNNCISAYYRYLLTSKTILAHSSEELIVYTLLSKYNKINQQIVPSNMIISDNIKSFLASI